MKILIIHHFGGIGGGTNSCLDVASALINGGHEVFVGINNPQKQVKQLFCKADIKLITDIPEPIIFNYHSASADPFKTILKYKSTKKTQQQWERFFQDCEYDLLILNSMVQAPLVRIAKKSGKKIVVFIRETIKGASNSPLNVAIKKMISDANGIVYLTEYDKSQWNISNTLQYVIPDCVNESLFKYDGGIQKRHCEDNQSEQINILYLGGLNYAKGAIKLLKAIELLSNINTNIRLFILGEQYEDIIKGNIKKRLLHLNSFFYVKRCNNLIKKINKKETIVKTVGITDKPGCWYAVSDIVVFPVEQVHQARPIYEAGFFSLPIIVPKYDNFEGALLDNYNGVYYRKHSVKSLALAIYMLAQNQSLRERLGQNNNRLYLDQHSYNKMKVLINELIKDISKR